MKAVEEEGEVVAALLERISSLKAVLRPLLLLLLLLLAAVVCCLPLLMLYDEIDVDDNVNHDNVM